MADQPNNTVRGTAGNDDVSALKAGSQVRTGAGDDILRGRQGDDILIGGAGNDQMYGGGGADQFRFFGNQIDGANDVDRIYDLDFSEGDTLVFGDYNGLFDGGDAAGLNSISGGDGAIISSYEGLYNAVQLAGSRASFKGDPDTNLLFVTFDNGNGQTQTLRLNGGLSAFLAAGTVDA